MRVTPHDLSEKPLMEVNWSMKPASKCNFAQLCVTADVPDGRTSQRRVSVGNLDLDLDTIDAALGIANLGIANHQH